MMAVPLVSVSISLRSPIRPREGTWNSRRTRPEPWFTIFTILPLRRAELFDHHADEVLGAIDDQQFQRLVQLAVDGLGQDFGLADGQLEAFAAHHFDQDGELQFAAAHHFEGVGAAGFFDSDGDVGEQFFIQAVAQIARGDELALRGPRTARC